MMKMAIWCLCCLLLTGCMKGVRLNERGIVEAVAVDLTEEGEYLVTMQVCEANSDVAAPKEEAQQCVVVEETAETLIQAISDASISQGKQMFLGSCKLVLLGETLVSENLEPVLEFLNGNHQIDPACSVLVSRDTEAGEILQKSGQGSCLNASWILDSLQASQKEGLSPKSRLIDLLNAVYGENLPGILGVIHPDPAQQTPQPTQSQPQEGEQAQQEGQPPQEESKADTGYAVSGMALIEEGRLEIFLNETAAKGYAWTRNGMKNPSITISADGFGRIAAVAISNQAKLSPEMVGDNPVLYISVDVHSSAREVYLEDAQDENTRSQVQELQAREIKRQVEELLESTQRQGYDVLRLSLLMQQRYPDYYEANRENWEEAVKSFGYDVEVTCQIDRFGVRNVF